MADGNKQQLAEDRTDWAWQRNLLAEQRTFSAWVRTGLAALAVGFGVFKLLGETEPRWVVYAGGGALVAAGVLVHMMGFWGYWRTFRRLRRQGLPGLPIWSIALITLCLLFSGLLMLALVLGEAGLLPMVSLGLKA